MVSCEVSGEQRVWASACRFGSELRTVAVPVRIVGGLPGAHVLVAAPNQYGERSRTSKTKHASWRWRVEYWPATRDLVPLDVQELAVKAAREHLSLLIGRMHWVCSEGREPARLPPSSREASKAAAAAANAPPPPVRRVSMRKRDPLQAASSKPAAEAANASAEKPKRPRKRGT